MKAAATCIAAAMAAALNLVTATTMVQAQDQAKPNILIIWGDDIGYWNISAYNQGMMGYKTPNIDRLAKEGGAVHRLLRPAELHRRTRRVHHRADAVPHRPPEGRPPRRQGRSAGGGRDPRRTPQGARLRHRPVRQEPSRRPRRAPADRARLRRVLRLALPPQRGGRAGESRLPEGPGLPGEVRAARRTLHTFANPDGTQRIENTGPLTKKRMETVDEEFTTEAIDFMENAVKDDKPFFVWWNSTRMHIWTQLKPEVGGQDRPRRLSRRHGRA